ncbi:TPA: DUF1176 domain-containing protein [Enterobacter hormaechei subsp. xiangfangensis]|uniref:DUF1176 domain-containing protein n=2 Tax=Enterobacter hormaechei TaxID=158836 RepID=UPI0007985E2A|nr:DUF1176 domain-containing protein [Enterobacter hormaechei]KZP86474.1 hypothetical protein A3N47_03590 [Enterobacter hormaechei subsp. xiangfangensis]MCM7853288.1 DUF1176 domain-containing protein [Enterobacter hormaechei]MDU5331219.1 DUF1176 domain-containing protein [Enterobacter hormaechei]RTM67900.1 DUF1176 domain-containing protein [Enterobacter hormaechei subsp. xiangfangensis]SAG16547.1 Protein of uncharacterised function (DUF1176) [Enterobacter hormaechei]
MRYCVFLLFFICVLPAPRVWAAPAQQSFSDWQVTCNNQNFCVARNTGEHRGLVMSLSRSAGAKTDASLRIDLGGLSAPPVKEPDIAPRLLLDNVPLKLTSQHWQITPWHLKTDDTGTITTFLKTIQEGQALTLRGGKQTISLAGLKAALLFIDAQQKRVGSETAWIKKGVSPPLSVPPAPALKKVAVVNPTPTPLTHNELNDLLDYGNWRMNHSQCSLDPNRREVRVTALTDDKALMIISCEAGAYNTVDLAWLVSRKKPFAARSVRLRLPFTPSSQSSDMELMNASFDEKTRELTTLALGRGIGDCGIQTRWRFNGQRFRLVRYAEEPSCDNWNGPDAWPTLWITR